MITPKTKSLSILVKECDKAFSDYIRLRDSENGKINCFVCGKPVQLKQSHCGHFISRNQMSVRFDEMNAHAVCYECNILDSQHGLRYLKVMKYRYGDNAILALNRRAQSLAKFMRSDLESMIEDFKLRIKALKK